MRWLFFLPFFFPHSSIGSENDTLADTLMSFGLSPYFPGDRVQLQGKRRGEKKISNKERSDPVAMTHQRQDKHSKEDITWGEERAVERGVWHVPGSDGHCYGSSTFKLCQLSHHQTHCHVMYSWGIGAVFGKVRWWLTAETGLQGETASTHTQLLSF